MKSTLLCLVGLFSFISITSAQKVKLKDLDVKAKYQDLPNIGWPTDVSTYFVDLGGDTKALQQIDMTKTGIKNYIDVKGYTKIDENVGAGIYLSLEGPTGSTQELIKEDKKNKEGETWKEYKYKVTFSGSLKRKVIDATGSVLSEQIERYEKSSFSSAYTSLAKLKKNHDTKKFYISGRRAAASELLQLTNANLNTDFAFTPREKKVEFKRLKSKKHRKLSTFQKTEEITERAFAALTTYDNASFKEIIAPALQTWVDEEPGLSGSDKQEKKLKFLCQLNASLAYFYSEDYENASKYAKMIVDGDYKRKKGKRLVEEIDNVVKQIKKLNLQGRYFEMKADESITAKIEKAQEDRSAAIENGDIKAFPDFADKLNVVSDSKVLQGSYTTLTGGEAEGYWVFENTYHGQPDFREPKKIRFGFLKDGQIETGTPKFKNLQKIVIDGTTFAISDVKLGSGLTGLKLDNAVVQVLQDFERTQLVRIFPSFKVGRAYGQTSETEAEVAVYHKEKEKFMATKGLSSRMKAVQKIVSDCSAAKKEAEKQLKAKGNILQRMDSQGAEKITELKKILTTYDGCK